MTLTLLIDLLSEQRSIVSNLCTFLEHPVEIQETTILHIKHFIELKTVITHFHSVLQGSQEDRYIHNHELKQYTFHHLNMESAHICHELKNEVKRNIVKHNLHADSYVEMSTIVFTM